MKNKRNQIEGQRALRVNERKASLEQAQHERLQCKVERDLSNAQLKRSTYIDTLKKKLNAHNSKVQDVKAKLTSEEELRRQQKKEKLLKKLQAAQEKREFRLEQVKNVAQLSAQKKINIHAQEGHFEAAAPVVLSD